MMPPDPTHPSEERSRASHGPTWPWALGSLLLVGFVLVAMLAGRAVVSRAQQAKARVPAPAVPPLAVAAVAHPAGGVQLLALDDAAGRLAVLTSRVESPPCPPVGACPAPARPDAFALLDGATGATITSTPLRGAAAPATDATELLVDAAGHRAYAVSPQAVVIFSTLTGAATGGYALPDATGGSLRGAALTNDESTLILLTANELHMVDASSGRVLERQSLPSGMTALDGPVLDTTGGRCFVLAAANGRSSLLDFTTDGLRLSARYAVPSGARLGTLDAARNALYVLGGAGTTWRAPLDALRPGVANVPLTADSALHGAEAFGANDVLGHSYVVTPAGVRSLDTATGKALAALPLHPFWPATQPLLVDAQRGLLCVLAAHGSVVILHDGPPPAAISAATAAILARGAMATFFTDTNQDPPFASAETFPVAAGSPERPETRSEQYWIHFADRGWDGPHPGTASVSVASAPGQPGAYLVTFSLSWQQVSQRQHTWVCLVAADGAVQLQSDQGDEVP